MLHNGVESVQVDLVGSVGSVTGDCNVALLSDYLHPFVDFMFPQNDKIFKKGNA